MTRILTETATAPATTSVRLMLPKVHNCQSRQYNIFCANQSMKFKFDNIQMSLNHNPSTQMQVFNRKLVFAHFTVVLNLCCSQIIYRRADDVVIFF